MNNISDKDAMREKFEEFHRKENGEIYNYRRYVNGSYISQGLRDDFKIYQAAYESCLSEFEQVAVFGEAEQIHRTDAGKTAEMQAHSIGTPLFTRKG
jgi:hypothetical protein